MNLSEYPLQTLTQKVIFPLFKQKRQINFDRSGNYLITASLFC